MTAPIIDMTPRDPNAIWRGTGRARVDAARGIECIPGNKVHDVDWPASITARRFIMKASPTRWQRVKAAVARAWRWLCWSFEDGLPKERWRGFRKWCAQRWAWLERMGWS